MTGHHHVEGGLLKWTGFSPEEEEADLAAQGATN